MEEAGFEPTISRLWASRDDRTSPLLVTSRNASRPMCTARSVGDLVELVELPNCIGFVDSVEALRLQPVRFDLEQREIRVDGRNSFGSESFWGFNRCNICRWEIVFAYFFGHWKTLQT